MGNKLPTINLIKKDQNFFDKFIVWALTIGRALVIITEIIALGAFIYRFSLDQRLVDLHDNINQKKTLLSLLQKDEMTYRNLQTRLLNISQLSPQSGLMVGTYTNLSHIIPLDIIVGRVSVSQTGISLDIIAHTTASLANFITALQADHDIASISIDKLINKTSDGTLSVTVTLALANQGAPTP